MTATSAALAVELARGAPGRSRRRRPARRNSRTHIRSWPRRRLDEDQSLSQVRLNRKINPIANSPTVVNDPLGQVLSEALSQVQTEENKSNRIIPEEHVFTYDWSIKRLPTADKRNLLITAALPYVNNVPHLGNIIGAVLSADVFARFSRLRGHQVLFVCGTDEYGTATETKALEEGATCQEVCDRYYQLHASIYEWFQIRFDHFGRTSTPLQTAITHDIFKCLYGKGFFLEQPVEQSWCDTCQRFLADRYVEGECPLCHFPDARGDQCDGCGKLMQPTELLRARCKLCRHAPSVRSSTHLFLDLTRLQPQCEAWVEEAAKKGSWSPNSLAIAKAWLHDGLKPRCMTRDLKWGTSVPLEHFGDKVFYVWFDAPIGYLSITANYFLGENDEKGTPVTLSTGSQANGIKQDEARLGGWEKWWKNPEQVQLYQFMGKDNVPFHTVIFPSTLLGCRPDQNFTLLHHINTTEYLTYEGGKFSKSRKQGIFGTDARDSGISASAWRYYLLACRPEVMDTAFTWDDFAAKHNGELLANLGNLVNRVTKFVVAKRGTPASPESYKSKEELKVDDGRDYLAIETDLREKVAASIDVYLDAMEKVELRAGLKHCMAISSSVNAFLTQSKLDGKLATEHPIKCARVLLMALDCIYLLATLIEPFLPGTSQNILEILRVPMRKLPISGSQYSSNELLFPVGHAIGTPKPLFARIEEGLVKELRGKFAGSPETSNKPKKA